MVRDYFLSLSHVDSVLVVNSCARGQAVVESDLDFAILMKPNTTESVIGSIENSWRIFSNAQPTLLRFKQLHQFANLHLDIIDGNYIPANLEKGEPVQYFEVEIGNQICYAAPMHEAGVYFQELQNKWLPYYNEDLRLQRFESVRNACTYDLEHIPSLIRRELYFQAFDILCKAFQEYLQALFIANKTYPIAYNKWIREQIVKWLNMPDLYPQLPPILSVGNIESSEILANAALLKNLLNNLSNG
jgi:predicted nucleotidyltransferase